MYDSSETENRTMSKTTTSPARLPRDQRRAQLIDVAMDVFADHGYAQTTMDEIAQRAAVSKPVLYQHFKNKRDLFFTLIDFQFDTLRDRVIERMEAVDPASNTADEETAYQAVCGVFDFVAEPRGLYRLILDSSMDEPEELEARKERFVSQMVEAVSPYILDNSILDPASSKFITRGIASVVMFLATRWAEEHVPGRGGAEPIPLEKAVEHTVRFVAYGAIGFDLSNNPSA
ncbi:TetR/AcrR family transcriptional regulator [Enteractinococcus fodinae]|uniref:AcrR family transcriptional regulator n=1 Tax=Enteractinococcus fodinae TaxID=684663 RepID=A0ABU2AZ97_9MICC|nr:TetR/AcrR family transcriptional regulator [Enteractinococcus fodinae]MDR7346670.1 AcrR family transcriptional regulator [Enteractinococcus fodinae]